MPIVSVYLVAIISLFEKYFEIEWVRSTHIYLVL